MYLAKPKTFKQVNLHQCHFLLCVIIANQVTYIMRSVSVRYYYRICPRLLFPCTENYHILNITVHHVFRRLFAILVASHLLGTMGLVGFSNVKLSTEESLNRFQNIVLLKPCVFLIIAWVTLFYIYLICRLMKIAMSTS